MPRLTWRRWLAVLYMALVATAVATGPWFHALSMVACLCCAPTLLHPAALGAALAIRLEAIRVDGPQ